MRHRDDDWPPPPPAAVWWVVLGALWCTFLVQMGVELAEYMKLW